MSRSRKNDVEKSALEQVAELQPASGDGGGHHLLRWLVLIAMVLGLIAAGRRFALHASDKEFEERLKEADANRD